MEELARLVCGQAFMNASAFTSAQKILEALVHAATDDRTVVMRDFSSVGLFLIQSGHGSPRESSRGLP
jgi:hypothetical protein